MENQVTLPTESIEGSVYGKKNTSWLWVLFFFITSLPLINVSLGITHYASTFAYTYFFSYLTESPVLTIIVLSACGLIALNGISTLLFRKKWVLGVTLLTVFTVQCVYTSTLMRAFVCGLDGCTNGISIPQIPEPKSVASEDTFFTERQTFGATTSDRIGCYTKIENDIYCVEGGMYGVYKQKLLNVDQSTFEVIDGHYYAKDKNQVYFSGAIIPKADPDTFKVFKRGGYEKYYAKDTTAVYLNGVVLSGANPLTFTVPTP
jgi:hypothetical protein